MTLTGADRTIPNRTSRGLVGHSMGGYGARPLKQYRAIAIDVGDKDNLKVDASRLHDALTAYGISHDFEIYPGTHTSRVAFRFQEKVRPFFSKALSFEPGRNR